MIINPRWIPQCRYTDATTRANVIGVLKLLENVKGVIQFLCKPETNGPLKLKPVGRVCDPKFMRFSEMAQAIKAVLHALAELHKRDFCHCDVRWPNVIFDVWNNTFVLTESSPDTFV